MSTSNVPNGPNPYQSPSFAGSNASAQNMPVSDLAIELLLATRPWVRFMSILGFLGALLMVVGAIVFILMFSGDAQSIGVGAAYVLIGILYFFGALFLWRYASCISDLELVRHSSALESALAAQKSFWRFIGITTAVIFVLYAAILVMAFVFGAMRMFS